jgi:hypothetical protein
MDIYSLIALASFLGGLGVGLLAATIPELIQALRLIRRYVRTHDRRRAVELWLEDEARRRSR